MLWILGLVTVLHVVPAVFWGGSTAVLARTGAAGIEGLARPQIGSAVVAALAGFALWGLAHHGAAGLGEKVLGGGALLALTAAGLQAASLPRVRQLVQAEGAAKDGIRKTLAVRQRIAGLLLLFAIAAMVTWRYF